MNVSSITTMGAVQPAAVKAPAEAQQGHFGRLVSQQLQDINQHQIDADAAIEKLAIGQSDDVQDVVLSMAKADLTFRLVLEIRNRLIESYQEIMRMQV